MEKYMNKPELAEINAAAISRTFEKVQDIKSVARQYCLLSKEVKVLLKKS